MSIKFTKKQLEKIIKEETRKLLSEGAALDVYSTDGRKTKVWTQANHAEFKAAVQKVLLDDDYVMKLATQGEDTNLGGKKVTVVAWRDQIRDNPVLSEFYNAYRQYVRGLIPSLDFAQRLVHMHVIGHYNTNDKFGTPRSIEGLLASREQMKASWLAIATKASEGSAEYKDGDMEGLDRFDGAVGRAGTAVNYERLVNRVVRENLERIRDVFWDWISGTLGGGSDKPEDNETPDTENCKKAKAAIAALDNLPDGTRMPASAADLNTFIAKIEKQGSTAVAKQPALQEIDFSLEDLKAKGSKFIDQAKDVIKRTSYASPKDRAKVFIANYYKCPESAADVKYKRKKKTSGGGGGGCPRPGFYRIIANTLGKPANQATKDVQEVLVNLGYSVKRGMASTPFGPGGQGTVDSNPKGFRQYGIDGKCGPSTDAAIIKFQKDNGLKPDGLVGSKTLEALNAAARGGVSKPKPSSEKRIEALRAMYGRQDFQSIRNVFTAVKAELFRMAVAQKKGQGFDGDVLKKMELQLRKEMAFYLPDLIGQDGRTVKSGKSLKETAAQMIANLEQALDGGMDRGPNLFVSSQDIGKALDKAVSRFANKVNESKSYDLDFGKWSKLWK